MNPAFSFEGITAFHCGIFATFYFCAAFAVWVYYRHIRGDIALALQSVAAGIAHVFVYLIGVIDPDSPHLNLTLAGYCCCASPTIMLCLREAIEPGWISWKRYFQYVGPFLVGTLIAGITAREYIFYIMVFANFWFCCYAAYKLTIGINNHERLIKQYFSELDSYSNNWVKYFVYFQVANVVFFFLLYEYLSVTLNILFNYVQAAYWLYFLLKCKEYRYYSRQIPKELEEDISTQAVADEKTATKESIDENASDKNSIISQETMDYIEKRLADLEDNMHFLEESLNLASLAQAVGTNRTYMSVYFRSKNTTFWDYINGKRCEYAIEIMKEQPAITMSALARRSGYKTENCFRSSFTTIYGKTPFVYKRDLRLNSN